MKFNIIDTLLVFNSVIENIKFKSAPVSSTSLHP